MQALKRFAIKFAYVFAGIAVVVALFNFPPFVAFLHHVLGTAFSNVMFILDANVGLIALCIVCWVVWRSFKKPKGKK